MSIFFELIENQPKTCNENNFNAKQNERKLRYTNRIPLQSTARCGRGDCAYKRLRSASKMALIRLIFAKL